MTARDVPARLASLPEKLCGQASFEGLPPGTRFVLDGSDDVAMARAALEAVKRELAYAERTGRQELAPATFLALSGGENLQGDTLAATAPRHHSLHVIRNSRPGADFATAGRSTVQIAALAVSALIGSQGVGDLLRLYVIAQRHGIDYNANRIPENFADRPDGLFDTAYMNRLFQVGREAIANGTAWSRYPPGFDPTPLSLVGSAGD